MSDTLSTLPLKQFNFFSFLLVIHPRVPLEKENTCYMLGTDFKAGQTKFKTAAVEYIRALGMCPKVTISGYHHGMCRRGLGSCATVSSPWCGLQSFVMFVV